MDRSGEGEEVRNFAEFEAGCAVEKWDGFKIAVEALASRMYS